MPRLDRVRSLKNLVVDAVDHGAAAIERVHLETAARPFALGGEAVAPLKLAHDAAVRHVYGQVRGVTRLVGLTVDVALDVAGRRAVSERGPTTA
jgi:hypothetical protein